MLLTRFSTIRLIGYTESTITQESVGFFAKEFDGSIEIVSPDWFIKQSSDQLDNATYGVAFTLDQSKRQSVINKIKNLNLDCIIYIHPTALCFFDMSNEAEVRKHVGTGSFIGPMSTLLIGSSVGEHCIIESYCLISHYVHLANNVQLHSGVMIAGRSTIGDDCMLNFRCTVLPKVDICSNVEVGAISTITKNIETAGRYVGSPARRVGDRIEFDTQEGLQ